KIDDPMIVPATIATALRRVRGRGSSGSDESVIRCLPPRRISREAAEHRARFFVAGAETRAKAATGQSAYHLLRRGHSPLEDLVTTASSGQIGTLVLRMQGAFLDSPGLTLTVREAEQRFGVDEMTCQAVLGALVDAGVLTK